MLERPLPEWGGVLPKLPPLVFYEAPITSKGKDMNDDEGSNIEEECKNDSKTDRAEPKVSIFESTWNSSDQLEQPPLNRMLTSVNEQLNMRNSVHQTDVIEIDSE